MVRKVYKTVKDIQGDHLFFYRGENILALKRHDIVYRDKILDFRGVDGREEVFIFTGFDRIGKVEEKFITTRPGGLFDVVTFAYYGGGIKSLKRGILDKEGFEIFACDESGDMLMDERIGNNPKNRMIPNKEHLTAAISLGLFTHHCDVPLFTRYTTSWRGGENKPQ